ncbi:hypothetical protein J3458_005446 [Metarhizium acridum]|uniref:uncharacterized protein n=1 Tax=Metarhizium acridum TaxID=92637 RepID=UPI001C6C56CA|nr:hypothetical protein J3458_005446 [Metarhizium acridum]
MPLDVNGCVHGQLWNLDSTALDSIFHVFNLTPTIATMPKEPYIQHCQTDTHTETRSPAAPANGPPPSLPIITNCGDVQSAMQLPLVSLIPSQHPYRLGIRETLFNRGITVNGQIRADRAI